MMSPDENENIQGLGGDEDAAWGDYPIDTVLIRSESRTVFDVLRRIEKGSFVMNPDFQRDFIWSEEKQSKLIESVLLRIPLPVLYLAEDDEGRTIVVDGLQRLSTFRRFVSDKLRLKLPDQIELNKKRFSDLSPKLQNRIEDCNLVLYLIDAKVPERARLDIFERVNGGVPLTRQQMRNCLFMGKATQFLKDESKTEIFLKATGNSLKTTTMRDREFVNRFCSFHLLPLSSYRHMDDFLADGLKRMNQLNESELVSLSAEFRTGLSNNFKIFDKHAFRKHESGQDSRSVINASIWDVMITGLSRRPEHIVEARAEKIRKGFFALLQDEDFVDSVTYSPNSSKKVNHRFSVATTMFAEVFDADES